MHRFGVALACALFLAPAAAAEEYIFDLDHTEIRMSWSHLGFSTTSAYFRTVDGSLHFNESDPAASTIEVVIDTASIDTGRPEFDAHLRSDDFFHVDEFPQGHFRSTEMEPRGDHRYDVHGELTLMGITRPVTLDVTLNRIDVNPVTDVHTIGLDATAEVDRSDFDLGLFTPMVGDRVEITISSEMIRKADLD